MGGFSVNAFLGLSMIGNVIAENINEYGIKELFVKDVESKLLSRMLDVIELALSN